MVEEEARTFGNSKEVTPDSGMDELQKPHLRVILAWDLDETLIVFQSLLSGKFVKESLGDRDEAHTKREAQGKRIGEAWSELILEVSDEKLFFSQVCLSTGMHLLSLFMYVLSSILIFVSLSIPLNVLFSVELLNMRGWNVTVSAL